MFCTNFLSVEVPNMHFIAFHRTFYAYFFTFKTDRDTVLSKINFGNKSIPTPTLLLIPEKLKNFQKRIF